MVRYKEAPQWVFDNSLKHLFFLAHFDDESPYVGLLSRLKENVEIAWLTNGDGLAYTVNADPKEYARKRKEESLCAVEKIGIPKERLHFLDFSEIEIYQNFTQLPGSLPFFRTVADRVEEVVKEISPDVLWVLAYQGGQPEHDLSHLLAVRAVMSLNIKGIFELPEYEYTILLPFRFRPWLDMEAYRILLTQEEILLKEEVLGCYGTQKDLISKFLKVVELVSRLSNPLKGKDARIDFVRKEVFAPVPQERDYTKSPHIHQVFDYMFDDYKGIPIRFEKTLGLLARFFAP